MDMVAEVEVTIDLPAVTNPAAAARFTNISGDLKNAIMALLVDRIATDGEKVGIDILEVELRNTFTETVGIVSITDPLDSFNFRD